jgi:hypothetical protein
MRARVPDRSTARREEELRRGGRCAEHGRARAGAGLTCNGRRHGSHAAITGAVAETSAGVAAKRSHSHRRHVHLGAKLAPDTDDLRVMRAKIEAFVRRGSLAVRGGRHPERRRLCRPSTYDEAVHACPLADDERPGALTHHPPVAGQGLVGESRGGPADFTDRRTGAIMAEFRSLRAVLLSWSAGRLRAKSASGQNFSTWNSWRYVRTDRAVGCYHCSAKGNSAASGDFLCAAGPPVRFRAETRTGPSSWARP